MSKYQEFFIAGKSVEIGFSQTLIKNLGGKVWESDAQTDIHKHIDLFWEPDIQNGYQNKCKKYGIDVKGLKKSSRSGNIDENIHWIELQNVKGNSGWLFGEADMFAFETIDYWIIVGKVKLKKFIHEKMCKYITENPSKELYHLYQRPGRQDIIMKIKTLDLMAIANKILWK